MLTCPRSSLSFHSNAHHHGSLPQQLGVVWDLLLKADPEGPSPIFHAALRHRFHTHTGTPSHVSLQHTWVKKLKQLRELFPSGVASSCDRNDAAAHREPPHFCLTVANHTRKNGRSLRYARLAPRRQ